MTKIQVSYYAIIPADVRYSDITPNAKLLYGEITALCNKEGFCWAGNPYFADLYNTDPRTISRWVGELKNKGFIYYEIVDKVKRKIYLTYDKNVVGVRQKCRGWVGQKCPHNNTSNNNTINKIAAKAADSPKKKEKIDPKTPMNLQEFFKWCKESPQRHIQIIADYADQKKAEFNTRGQWEEFIARNSRAARSLSPYTDQQIEKAVKEILKADYLTKWTLETVYKYLIK